MHYPKSRKDPARGTAFEVNREPLSEESFQKMIALERKRTERSQKPFILMLVEGDGRKSNESMNVLLNYAICSLMPIIRETDVVGWYKDKECFGVIFPGLPIDDRITVLSAILTRMGEALQDEGAREDFNRLRLAFYIYPDDWEQSGGPVDGEHALYSDLCAISKNRKMMFIIKRGVDIVGSMVLLILAAPLFVALGAAIKLTSRGPVFFKQERVGQWGKRFVCLKFRSMYVNSDYSIHRHYAEQFIAGREYKTTSNRDTEGVFKLVKDERITPLGRLLRRSSVDELPQLVNVFYGDMSLVGPRPPIPYELAAYQTWHRLRLMQVKPGITGLWQVKGRSRVSFDAMVRLDLQYANSWSPWLDIKILLRTPAAVFKGAY